MKQRRHSKQQWRCYSHQESKLYFLNCHQIGINSIMWTGSSPENVAEVFQDGIFVGFHDEGTEEFVPFINLIAKTTACIVLA